MITEREETEMLQQLKNVMSEEQIVFGQAVSVCATIAELQLLRATKDDIIDGLVQRFQGYVKRYEIESTIDDIIEVGIASNLLERSDEESVSLTSHGMYVGNDWLATIRA